MSEIFKKNIGKLFAGEAKLKEGGISDFKQSTSEFKTKRSKINSDDQRDFVALGKSQSYNEKHLLVGSEKMILHSMKNRLPGDGSEPRKDTSGGKSWGGSGTLFAQLNASNSSIGTPGMTAHQKHAQMSTAQISKTIWTTGRSNQKQTSGEGLSNQEEAEVKPTSMIDKRSTRPKKGTEPTSLTIAQLNAQTHHSQGKEMSDLNRSLALDRLYRPSNKGNVFHPSLSQSQLKAQDLGRQPSHSNKTSQEFLKLTKDQSLNLGSTSELRDYHFVNKHPQSRQPSQMNSSKAGSAEIALQEELQTNKPRPAVEGLVDHLYQLKQSGPKLKDSSSTAVGHKPHSDSWKTEPEKLNKFGHTRAGSTSPSPSVGSSHNLKGSSHEVQYKWSLIGERLESKIEKSFDKLFRELRELKKEVILSLRSQIESGMQTIKKTDDCEEIYIELQQVTSFQEINEFVRNMMKSEVLKIKVEQEKILDISDYVLESSRAEPETIAPGALPGNRKPVKRSHDGSQPQRKETSFTQFFENNKPDFLDSLDPETFFQNLSSSKRGGGGTSLLVDASQSPSERVTGVAGTGPQQEQGVRLPIGNNYFQQSFKP